jgi:ATP-dependent Lhr-like helicase
MNSKEKNLLEGMGFHPVIARWFSEKFKSPTIPQEQGWPAIATGQDTLIAAPTGSGKTLTSFLVCIDKLLRQSLGSEEEGHVGVIYVSPLKALSNDIKRNLEAPLAEIDELSLAMEGKRTGIRSVIRTGDTPAYQRQLILKKPPNILITTPESLFLLLTSEKSRRILTKVHTVIVDEIHALARDKRGSHLTLSLERLDSLCEKKPQRIGLSATQKPISAVAAFLTGVDANGSARPCHIVDAGHQRTIDLDIEVPPSELSAVCSNEQWDEIYAQIRKLIEEHRSTLIFVNTRKMAERVAFHLSQQLGPDAVASHHGSLAREKRLDAEERLKSGELRAIVATASLELGIDIGYIDLVCQIGSPKSIATFLQRIGRSGHARHAVPKGRLFALTRDELLEAMALVLSVRRGELDKLEIPLCPLDILAQQIVAEVACRSEEEVKEQTLFDLAKKAWPFKDLERAHFDATVTMLSDGYAEDRRQSAWLHRDQVNNTLKARKGARLATLTAGGAIPETGDYRVVTEDGGAFVGTINEDFAIESSRGDVFLLGNTSWQIRQITGSEVLVRDMNGAPPTIPFWLGEAPGRTVELSYSIANLREEVANLIQPPENADDPLYSLENVKIIAEVNPLCYQEAFNWLSEHVTKSNWAIWQAVHYIGVQKAALGIMPSQKHIIYERFFDDTGGMQLVIHSPFGMRINRGFGLALRKRFCRSFDFELQASADDNGIVLSLGPQHSFPIESLFKMLNQENIEALLEQAILAVPLFQIRWRWNANRSLAVLRSKAGKKVPPALQRWRSDDLMTAIFPAQTQCQEHITGDIEIPHHPLVFQTMYDCLHEAIDIDGLKAMVGKMQDGTITQIARDTREPSPFSYQLLNAYPYAFLDDAPLEERRARAVATRRSLSIDSMNDLCVLDKDAALTVAEGAWPDARNEDELHDALMSMVIIPAADRQITNHWRIMFAGLAAKGRAATLTTKQGKEIWFAAEQYSAVTAAYAQTEYIKPLLALPQHLLKDITAEDARIHVLKGYTSHIGITTANRLAEETGLPKNIIDLTLPVIESRGALMRGHYTSRDELEWCDRRLLARIHRLTLDGLRRQIKPVAPHEFVHFLTHWQHLAAGTRLHGREGLIELIDMLQGYDAAAGSWESEIIPARMTSYLPIWIDELSHGGVVTWGRLRTPEKDEDSLSSSGMTKSAPIALMIRDDVGWLLPKERPDAKPFMRSNAQTVYEAIATSGALFLNELRLRTNLPETHIEEALGELAHLGLIHADGFGAVRPYLVKQRSKTPAFRGLSRKFTMRPSLTEGSGRWSLFPPPVLTLQPEAALEEWARLLLKRYGIIFKDMLKRESAAPSFYELLPSLRLMEARGEIRGGRFVAGAFGEQFALPEAVEKMRDLRNKEKNPKGDWCIISAADPLNLSGIITSGEKIPANRQTVIALCDGKVSALRENSVTNFLVPLPPEMQIDIERAMTLNGVFRNRLQKDSLDDDTKTFKT